MNNSWFHNIFSHARASDLEAARVLAAGGDCEAQFGLGLKYSTSDGGLPDLVQAVEWYRKAANQNHRLAQFNLGVMYAAGQGVPQDGAEARIWFDKAAHQGDAGAQYRLGRSHQLDSIDHLAKNAAESRIEAYKWFYLAAAQGYKGSVEARELVNMTMSRDEVVEGNQRVAALAAKTPDAPQV